MQGIPEEEQQQQHEEETPQCPLREPHLPLSPLREKSPSAEEEVVPYEIDDCEEEDPPLQDMDADVKTPPPSSTPARKQSGKKIKPLTTKQRAIAKEKLQNLTNLNPKPFLPSNAELDVSQHERAFRLLGLWDFVNLRLDREIRKDLLVELIAYYDRAGRRSLVKSVRVSVTRSDLARALDLPGKKSYLWEIAEADLGFLEEKAVVSALVKFLLSWIVIAGEAGDDFGIIPDEAQGAIRSIESGQAHKLDWAGLMWTMVEKEILDAPKSGFCYYASHLQRLMRFQKPGLFEEEEPLMEVPEVEEEEHVNMPAMSSAGVEIVENLNDAEPEKQQQSVGFDADVGWVKNVVEESGQQQQQWLLGAKSDVCPYSLRPCSSNDVQGMEIDGANEDGCKAESSEMHESNLTSKFPSLDNCADLLQGIDAGNVQINLPLQQALDTSAGEFLASPIEAHKNISPVYCPPGSSLFGNVGKRLDNKVHGEEDDNDSDDIHHFHHGISPKRMRTDGSWDHAPSEFDTCMDQLLNWAGKAKLMFEQKEHDTMNAHMQLQMLSDALQQKDQVIQSLERSRLEDQHKMQLEVCQFEHERTVMSHMVIGYQKALRGTRQALADCRKQVPRGVEPLYEDVAGSGGVVLTTRELERQRLEKSEKERQRLENIVLYNSIIIKKVNAFTKEWSGKFENYEDQVHQLAKRLEDLSGEMSILKDKIAKKRDSDENMITSEDP